MSGFAGLFDSFFDSKMEGFETAFPGVVRRVNADGTVDVTPSIRNVLKNMQVEPDGKDGRPLPVEGVPVLWPGTSSAVAKFELAEGDPLLLVASSRDLREWASGGEGNGPYTPKSFSGNDLNDLVAIPVTAGRGSRKTTVSIARNGTVKIKCESVELDAGTVKISGELEVGKGVRAGGSVEADGEVTANAKILPVNLSTHTHVCAAPGNPSSPPSG